jgi:CheR methyltransferase, SAM binding domain
MSNRPYRRSIQVILHPALVLLCSLASFSFHPSFYPAGAQITASFIKDRIVFTDIPPQLSPWLEGQGINAGNFSTHISSINKDTEGREVRGEYDHLIYFLLQSMTFTRQPRIEPALSSQEFVNGLNDADRKKYLTDGSDYLPSKERVPKTARARMMDFIKAVGRQSADERLKYFNSLLSQRTDSSTPLDQHLYAEYARSMKFLYLKEFASRAIKKEQHAAFIGSLYQDRGHSTDTQIEANYAVYVALASLKAQSPSTRIRKVLIVGPGLDFAPRTDLIDLFGPQSYQPFAVADALIGLKLAEAAHLHIHCVDINQRVVNYLSGLKGSKQITLSILSGIRETALRPLTSQFKEYFRGLGKSIGIESDLKVPATYDSHLKKILRVGPEIGEMISVDRLNIITERYEPAPNYDLIVVTNVFPYFKQTELIYALANIAAMMAEGGYLIHNELQTVPSSVVTPLSLPLQLARTVLIAPGGGAPLYDGVAIHQKR